MGSARAMCLALVAMMTFAAVAQAQFPPNSKVDKQGKKVIIKPVGTLFAGPPQGRPEPFQKKAVFIKNNTIIHPAKPVKMPKIKEAPIKDNTVKQPSLNIKPKVEFIKNNTIIHPPKPVKMPKMKEAPIKDNTVKQPSLNLKLKTQFIKNNTIINKPQIVKGPVVKELPIKDITKPSKQLFKGVAKQGKDDFKQQKQFAHQNFTGPLLGNGRRLSRRAL